MTFIPLSIICCTDAIAEIMYIYIYTLCPDTLCIGTSGVSSLQHPCNGRCYFPPTSRTKASRLSPRSLLSCFPKLGIRHSPTEDTGWPSYQTCCTVAPCGTCSSWHGITWRPESCNPANLLRPGSSAPLSPTSKLARPGSVRAATKPNVPTLGLMD